MGLEPEQTWEDPPLAATNPPVDPTTDSIGFVNGGPAGSASPLTWAQSQYARLALAISAGRNLETPDIVSDRYVRHGPPGTLTVTITSPADHASVDTTTVPVSGTTSPGALVVAEASGGAGGAAAIKSTTADSGGNWSLSVPVGFGGTTITVTATLHRSTGYSQIHVTDVALPGTTVLDVKDLPPNDDNGPGTYAYPTFSGFAPGAFDLTEFKVSQTGTQVYLQATIRNLAQTFGFDFGAQLLDIYVHNPAMSSTSTSAAYSNMNYGIASDSAWTERLEAQGFAPTIWVDSSGNSLGNAQFVVDDTTGTATLILPQGAFGTPTAGSGWVFTVALTGQGADQPPDRAFTQPAQDFTFGVCRSGVSSPICALDPNSVPKVMDTIPPAGVDQDTELDPTKGTVLLHGVSP